MVALWFALGVVSGMLVVLSLWLADGVRTQRKGALLADARRAAEHVNVIGGMVFPEVLDPRWRKSVRYNVLELGTVYEIGPISVVDGCYDVVSNGLYVADGKRRHKVLGARSEAYCRAVREADAERAAAVLPEIVQRALEEA